MNAKIDQMWIKKTFLKKPITYKAFIQNIDNLSTASKNDENISFGVVIFGLSLRHPKFPLSFWSVFDSVILNWKIVEFAKKRNEKLKVNGIK